MNYTELIESLNAYAYVLSLAYFDSQTIAPKQGANYHNKMVSKIEKEYYDLLTSSTTKKLLESLENKGDAIQNENIRLLLKRFKEIENIPSDEYSAYNNLKRESFIQWEQARRNNNYKSYEATLTKMFDTHKKMLRYRKLDKPLYELALDDYEEGLTLDKVQDFFQVIQERLVPFIDVVLKNQAKRPDFLDAYVSVALQQDISKLIMDHLGYTSDFGYLAESAHPFSSTFSKHDTRITTHYHTNNFTSNIFSIIHEIGHSMYNHQVDTKYEETMMMHSMSASLHESQSRLLENMIGRSKAFWTPIYPKLQALIPDVLSDVSLDAFIQGINYVEKGQIRTEADELTYPLHILVRTEFEQALIDEIPQDLNLLYNAIFKKYFGYEPQSDTLGILQDVHWSEALIGYFPTYALGTAYGAQFMAAMYKDIDVDALLIAGDLKSIFDWLKEHIHQYGGMIKTQDLIKQLTQESFNPHYYVDYLIDKYSKLLNIKEEALTQ